MLLKRSTPWFTIARFGFPLAIVVTVLATWPRDGRLVAQDDAATERDIDRRVDGAVARADEQRQAAPAAVAADDSKKSLNPWELYWAGGILMHPILALSFVVVLMTIERAIALRRSRVMPEELVVALGQMSGGGEPFDPKKAYRICQQFPSAAANVIRAMLLKVGRPHSEVEHAVAVASDKEATILYGNVRWITLSASIAPLLGLLGTVQGMIMAFKVTADAPTGMNKATMLAEGIYTALVTTFAGLSVAIPAVAIAYWFEGRILSLFRDVDDLAGTLLPHVERYEGKLRATPRSLEGERPVEATVVSGPSK